MKRLSSFACRIMLLVAIAILAGNVLLLCVTFPIVGYGLLVMAGWRFWRRAGFVSGNYGTARIAGLPDLIRGKLLSDRGIILGRVGGVAPPSKGQALRSLLSPAVSSDTACRMAFAALLGGSRGDFIRIRDFIHLVTFSPAGGGKSVAGLVPNLLSYGGNCVVVDPKGELYRLTHKHRRREFGHRIVRFDPALLCGPGADSFNPFDFIDPKGKGFIEQCRDLANMLVVRTGKELDPHWNDSAENVLAAFIAYICALEGNPDARNLRGMREQIASRKNYTDALEVMQRHEGFYGVLAQLGHSLTWHVEKELGSVLSSAQRHTHIFDAPLVDEATRTTSFDPMKLRTGRMTVYLITPADKLVVWAALQRLFIGCLLRVITRGVPTEKNPVLFMVDETAHIGHMQALEDAVTLMRGMGIRLWLFFQSIEQLKKCFGDNAGTVMDNLATQQYFSINSYETAEAISKRIGEETIVIRTESGNSGSSTNTGNDGKGGTGTSRGSSYNVSEVARRLLKPEEILVLPDSSALVFHKNNYVIVCNKVTYYADRAFRRRGILHRRFGTGRTQGVGVRGLVLALALLAVSFVVAGFVGSLPVPNRQPPGYAPAPYGPYGGQPLPYQPVQGGFIQ